MRPTAKVLQRVQGHVRFEHVSFAYGNGPEVLHDINIDATAGSGYCYSWTDGQWQKYASYTLLPRFYDVTEGRVTGRWQ